MTMHTKNSKHQIKHTKTSTVHNSANSQDFDKIHWANDP